MRAEWKRETARFDLRAGRGGLAAMHVRLKSEYRLLYSPELLGFVSELTRVADWLYVGRRCCGKILELRLSATIDVIVGIRAFRPFGREFQTVSCFDMRNKKESKE